MSKSKNNAPYGIFDDKQYKLSDFSEELEKYELSTGYIDNNRFLVDNNISEVLINGVKTFRYFTVRCPECDSTHILKIGFTSRKLIFLNKGEVICNVQRYKCKICNNSFSVDLSGLVYKNGNVTLSVIEKILDLYSIYGSSLHKIKYGLKKHFNVDISHQTIQNIIKNFKNENIVEPWFYSGYYLFDSLWVKINGTWNYLLALFDTKINTIISTKIVSSEDEKTIMDFINKSTINQRRISITTDLKHEYRKPIYKLGFKHQFCKFHTKQKINRDIHNHITKNNTTQEEQEKIQKYKLLIFNMLDAEDYESALNIKKELYLKQKGLPKPIFKILWKLIIPHFKNLTYNLKNNKIESTSNKIENIFQKVFPKHIKKKMKTRQGITKRFMLKLQYWDINNKKQKNTQSF